MALRVGLPGSSALQNDGLDELIVLQCRIPRETTSKGHWWPTYFSLHPEHSVSLNHPLHWRSPRTFDIHALMDLGYPIYETTFPCLGYPNMWGLHSCILTGAPQHIRVHSKNTGAPQFMGMHSHLLRYPNMWEYIPMYWGTPVHGNADPYTGIPQ